tara:strand:- start:151222 stop:151950 length:729 start_codon:yes stop_codon:yes gene_type:complete
MSYQVNLNNFQGPLDLLLFFIRRDELDIYDIPISSITSEFVAVIKDWEQMNMVIAGEFIDMASMLMRIKVKLLIPRPDLDEEGENIDPRAELIQKLVEYKRYRDAAEMLETLGKAKNQLFTRQFEQVLLAEDDDNLGEIFGDVSLYDIAKTFKKAMKNRPVISQFELTREPIQLEEQKEFLIKFFDGDGKLRFSSLLEKIKNRVEIIVTFLAILDLVREGVCTLKQNNIFGDIELTHHRLEA